MIALEIANATAKLRCQTRVITPATLNTSNAISMMSMNTDESDLAISVLECSYSLAVVEKITTQIKKKINLQ